MAEIHAETYDYIVVGAGSAGSVIANRLSADGKSSILVLEAGGPDRNPFLHIPAGYVKTLTNPKLIWPFKSEPGPGSSGRAITLPQGRVYGGSSSLNGLVYNRGQAEDFDEWARMGNPGWGYEDVLPYFRRSERRIGPGEDRYHGRNGRIAVSDPEWKDELCEAFIESVQSTGLARNPDYNGTTQEGVGYFQRMIEGRFRVSAATGFLHPALKRSNVSIRPFAQVFDLLIENGRVSGVWYFRAGNPSDRVLARCRGEVILCAGTINTTRLMQVSGIGDGATLSKAGVETRHHLPGVGRNFRDHYFIHINQRMKDGVISLNQQAKGWRLGVEIIKWLAGASNILSLSPSVAYAFCKSDASVERPDIQYIFTPGSYKPNHVYVLDNFPAVTCGFSQHRPESVGHISITSPDPIALPVIQPNYLSASTDQAVVVKALRLARRFMAAAPLARFAEREEEPGASVQSDEALLEFARRTGNTGYHFMGACAMGPRSNPLAVVAPDLRVHGLTGLRIADASVMPAMPSANTYASTLMIAEKGADLIKGISRA
ncbi:GMC family oxidoreductase N-terminal domain-containing protein [Mesorhizobium sp. 1M-11]|uniref:GMC family oxidoreductase n=1 Tax=Mesorhizobium sp. 1M-11 TaxID=1529006 RepID=UPI000ADEF193|nr:GMC family oxidoreductase N-terminal domain-containing protein [Mesorhizobium sp. 1M-11]